MVFSYLVSLVSLGAGVGFPLYKSLEAVEKKPSEVECMYSFESNFRVVYNKPTERQVPVPRGGFFLSFFALTFNFTFEQIG